MLADGRPDGEDLGPVGRGGDTKFGRSSGERCVGEILCCQ